MCLIKSNKQYKGLKSQNDGLSYIKIQRGGMTKVWKRNKENIMSSTNVIYKIQ